MKFKRLMLTMMLLLFSMFTMLITNAENPNIPACDHEPPPEKPANKSCTVDGDGWHYNEDVCNNCSAIIGYTQKTHSSSKNCDCDSGACTKFTCNYGCSGGEHICDHEIVDLPPQSCKLVGRGDNAVVIAGFKLNVNSCTYCQGALGYSIIAMHSITSHCDSPYCNKYTCNYGCSGGTHGWCHKSRENNIKTPNPSDDKNCTLQNKSIIKLNSSFNAKPLPHIISQFFNFIPFIVDKGYTVEEFYYETTETCSICNEEYTVFHSGFYNKPHEGDDTVFNAVQYNPAFEPGVIQDYTLTKRVELCSTCGLSTLTVHLKADRDADGLADTDETTIHNTEIDNPDTDGDGMTDGWEVKHGLNPLDPSDANSDSNNNNVIDLDECKQELKKLDSDLDGLNNYDELFIYNTNPYEVDDTDKDGLSDAQEINIYKTDRTNADTDGDGLNDGNEVNDLHSNPLSIDTDGDGLEDKFEADNENLDINDADADNDGWIDGFEHKYYGNLDNNPSADNDSDSISNYDESLLLLDQNKTQESDDNLGLIVY